MSVSELPMTGSTGTSGTSGTKSRNSAATGSGEPKSRNSATRHANVPTGLAEVIPFPLPRAAPAPPAPARTACRWPAYVLLVSGVALVPWLVVLALTLPRMAVAWAGLDAMESAGLIATGLLVLRGHLLRAVIAVATATLLLVDAWFDVTTSVGSDLAFAAVLAGVAELPLSGLCAALAVRALSLRQTQDAAA